MAQDVNIKSDTILSFTGQIVTAVLGLVTLILIARLGGVELVGTYYFAVTLAFLSSRVASGIAVALKKRVSEDGTLPDEYVSLALAVHVLSAVPIGAVFYGVSIAFPERIPSGAYMASVFLMFFTLGAFRLAFDTYSGLGHPGRGQWFDALRSGIRVTGHTVVLFLAPTSVGILYGNIVANALTFVVLISLCKVQFKLPSKSTISHLFEFARWSVPLSVVTNTYERYDVLILGFLIGTTAVGYYESAMRLATPILFVSTAIGNVLTVKTSFQKSVGGDVSDGLRSSMEYAGILAFPIAAASWGIGAVVLPTVFGESYATTDAFIALVGVMTFRVFSSYNKPLRSFFSGADFPKLVFKLQGVGLLINLPLSAILTYQYGLIGVVIGTLLVEVLMLLALLTKYSERYGALPTPKPAIYQLLSSIVMVGAVVPLVGLFEAITLIQIAGVVLFGGAVYFGTLLILWEDFRNLLTSAVQQT